MRGCSELCEVSIRAHSLNRVSPELTSHRRNMVQGASCTLRSPVPAPPRRRSAHDIEARVALHWPTNPRRAESAVLLFVVQCPVATRTADQLQARMGHVLVLGGRMQAFYKSRIWNSQRLQPPVTHQPLIT